MRHLILILLFPLQFTFAQQIVPLWPEGVPDCAIESAYKEEMDENIGLKTLSVQDPTLEIYLPAAYRANGAAVLICPGGGYYLQAYDWEGTEFAKWFNQQGIAAFVLKYRLPYWTKPPCSEHVALDDASQAMRMIRANAEAYNIDPERVGVMGFSAGGHLASTLSTHFDAGNTEAPNPIAQQSSRPDFSILVYAVISGDTTVSHSGSFKNLLGENPDPTKTVYYSNEKQVTAETPPAILIHAADDKGVPFENSIVYFKALQKHGITSALHIYSEGGHGFALAEDRAHLSGWIELVGGWMEEQGFTSGEE